MFQDCLRPSCWLVAGHGHGLMVAHGLIAILVLTAMLIVVMNFNVVSCWTIGWLLDMDMEFLLAALILCFGLFSFLFEGIIYLL
jgi:hypothetical protein